MRHATDRPAAAKKAAPRSKPGITRKKAGGLDAHRLDATKSLETITVPEHDFKIQRLADDTEHDVLIDMTEESEVRGFVLLSDARPPKNKT